MSIFTVNCNQENKMKRKPILYFEDAIGITSRYEEIFRILSREQAQNVSLYKRLSKSELLMWKGNRKHPGYRLDSSSLTKLYTVTSELLNIYKPELVVTSDPATLAFLMPYREESWDWATIENLRGGVYQYKGIPWIVTYPITAYFTDIRERDIAVANDGFDNQEDFNSYQSTEIDEADEGAGDEEDEADEADTTEIEFNEIKKEFNERDDRHFYAPVITKVSVGKFCLAADWHKAFRIIKSQRDRAE